MVYGSTHTMRDSSRSQLVDIHMVSNTVGLAIGSSSKGYSIMRTTDGGHQWANISPKNFWPQSAYQIGYNRQNRSNIDFDFQNGEVGWVALVVVFPDASLKQNSSSNRQLPQLAMGGLNSSVAGVLIERTVDGGLHWRRTLLPISADLDGQIFLRFVGNQGTLLMTSSAALGIMSKVLYHSVDAGKTWQMISSNLAPRITEHCLPNKGYPTGISFRSASEGWVTFSSHSGKDEQLYKTFDSGKTWINQTLVSSPDRPKNLVAVSPPAFFGIEKNEGVLPTRISADKEAILIYLTHDGGKKWVPQNAVFSSESPFFVSASKGYVLNTSKNAFYVTNDSGQTWIQTRPKKLHVSRYAIAKMDFISDKIGWILATDNYSKNKTTTLLETLDGTNSWTVIYSAKIIE